MVRASPSARTSPSMPRAASSARSARARSPVLSTAARSSSVRPRAAEDGVGGAADVQQRDQAGTRASARRRRRVRPRAPRSAASGTDQGSTAAVEPMMIAETLASVISSGPPPTSTAADMANTIMRPTCGGPVAEEANEQVGDQHPEHHAARQFQRPLALLAHRGAETDHGGDRGKAGLALAKQQLRQVPSDQGGAHRLQDRPQLRAQPPQVLSGARGGRERHRGAGRRRSGRPGCRTLAPTITDRLRTVAVTRAATRPHRGPGAVVRTAWPIAHDAAR